MEIISGYFISRGRALEAADYLRNQGFRGEISVIGRSNHEDFSENDRNNIQDTSMYEFIFLGGFANPGGFTGLNGITPLGNAPIVAAWPFTNQINGASSGGLASKLDHWGLAEDEEKEIKSVIESGNTVLLIKSKENDKSFVLNTLKDKGAQNIHI